MAEQIKARNNKVVTWDVEAGKKMYDAGMRICDIARALGTGDNRVRAYASRHWTPAAMSGYTPREG